MQITSNDLKQCKLLIKEGSHSFYAASRLLPKYVRDPAIVLYAFCRIADDVVDKNTGTKDPILDLKNRLNLVYNKNPRDIATDRAFAALVNTYDLPKELPYALIEGLQWDYEGRRFSTLSELYGYCARVASSVGVMMCILMNVRDEDALARACDLGVAMQLTNIARDVGEDARNNRLYIPLDWMKEREININQFFERPEGFPEVSIFVKKILAKAEFFYKRAGAGYFSLPKDCRPGIFSAGKIYSKIGKHIAASNYNSINERAYTTTFEKFLLILSSVGDSALTTVMPMPSTIHAPPISEVEFLLNAVKNPLEDEKSFKKRSKRFMTLLFELERKDRFSAGIHE
jgi:phytoene synthase